MTESDIFVIEKNIARYQAMLNREMDQKKRSTVQQLLTEAKADLTLAALKALV